MRDVYLNPINLNHIPIPKLREMFNQSLADEWGNVALSQLDIALNNPTHNFKLLHHILIARYAKVTMHHRDTMIPLIGLDIETDYQTGEPKLLGYSYADGFYFSDDTPTLESFYRVVKGVMDNSRGTHFATWGNLDINCLIRLFNPTPDERLLISRGIGGKWRDGEWKQRPPLIREINGTEFCVDFYISGRSLRLSIVAGGRNSTIWVYNLSQFYTDRIANSAKALGYDWRDFAAEHPEEPNYSHLINWERYRLDLRYHTDVLASNEQDARTVRMLADNLQSIFHQIFGAYPSLLVSAGSLADAAVSKLLTLEDYESNSWQYLKYSTFGSQNPVVNEAENILSEAYSAGYVDQFTIGYHPQAFYADISSAYPHKIRQLPDLRYCQIIAGVGSAKSTVKKLEADGFTVFTVVYRGLVTIPEGLEYHPITVKTAQKQNIRPLGTFKAAYFAEEREFCKRHGAKFSGEEWTIFALTENKPAPIANVSLELARMRELYRAKMNEAANDEESTFYDSLQTTVKVVDNSLYGKNVMTTEIVEEIDGKPVVTGYKAGDRFNMLYGAWITALTRTQLADACMSIAAAGGQPVLAMTDSVYWTGRADMLPKEMVSHKKTAGTFEPPAEVRDFFVVKTGQYEFRCVGCKIHPKPPYGFHHKMRGLNLPYEDRDSAESFYRARISEWLLKNPRHHPEDIEIPVNTRKLVTIGSPSLDNLGMVADGQALMRPYVLSGKQSQRYVMDFRKTLEGSIRLKPAIAAQSNEMDSPLEFLSGLNKDGGDYITRFERKRIFYLLIVKLTGLTISKRFNGKMPLDRPQRLSAVTWEELEQWSGIKREWSGL